MGDVRAETEAEYRYGPPSLEEHEVEMLLLRAPGGFSFPSRWMGAKENNRIGRIVFLGVPFFSKIWNRHLFGRPSGLLTHSINALFYSAVALTISYLMSLFFWASAVL